MSTFAERYTLRTDGNGLAIITLTGRCTTLADIREIEGSCTRRFEMVNLPHASGATLKPLDGTRPVVLEIAPPAFEGRSYQCVKIDGRVNPFAIRQVGGPFDGEMVHQFQMVYQQVGGVS